MKKAFERVRGFFAKRRKLGAIAIALIVIELAAAGTVAIAGREWIDSVSATAKSGGGRAPAPGFSGSLSAPSLAVF